METIAITNWNGIVSPVFDVARCFMIVKHDGNRLSVDVKEMSLFEKIDYCSKNGVNVIICGAISNIALLTIQDNKIKVISWISGSVDEIIDAHLNHKNITDHFSMPGCNHIRCQKCRRFRNRGNFRSGI